ncbi:MAG: archease [Candidatus Pacearchaeota archaeon]
MKNMGNFENKDKFKFLEHTADIKFQAFGETLEKAFENSAYALKDIISKDKTKNEIIKRIKINGKDLESLLLNFLEEFLILFDMEGFLLSEISKIKIDKNNFVLTAEIFGDYAGKYEIRNHVKAITYNEMFVKKHKNTYIIQVVVDV